MKMKQLNDYCYYFHSSVNVGYVHEGDQGLLIDAGIDASSIRKVVRQLEEKDLPITHLFVTHAHADHFGGASYLKKHYDVKIIAPPLEAVIMKYPVLEPTYLFQGTTPPDELRNKFLEGPPIDVDIVIDEGQHQVDGFEFECLLTPGHSYHQLAIAMHGILFAADSYFGEKELYKHKIPFLTCANDTIKSIEKLMDTNYDGALPGHGKFEENYHDTLQINIDYHRSVLKALYEMVRISPHGLSLEDIVAYMCARYDVNAEQLSQYLLFRTAVSGYVKALIDDGDLHCVIDNYRIMVQAS
ncbi:glyoxylase-like metal-dependent hydrolase (beta-lactamase superfamily II) [Alkalibacillus flavidus]|uniref:Glyoxylase-like metal-dependent hydrolase (Beta-lactamase superfamily II) n=1 Tax=Alkalibacillus flavidus TaxID=546021 RepID=A0ABV2KUU7_9BACI